MAIKKFKPFKIDILGELDLDIPKDKRADALDEAATFLKEQLLSYIGEQKSPISGGEWVKGLTKEYKHFKREEGGSSVADLELHGDLLDSLSVDVDGKYLVIDVGDDQRGKAAGHYTGIYGANSHSERPRQFAPQKGDTLKRQILSDLKKLLSEFEE